MEALKKPAPNMQTGKRELTHTEKLMLVSARDVMATIQDALNLATRSGLKIAITSYPHNGIEIAVMAVSIPKFDVVARNGTFEIDGRAITDPIAWDDLRDVMADKET